MFLSRKYFFLTNSPWKSDWHAQRKRLRHNPTGIETDNTCLTEKMLTFGSLGKWISLSPILRTGLRVGPNRSSPTPEQAWRDNRLAAGTVPESRTARAAGPTILVGLKGHPRLSRHKFQRHCNVQAHRSCSSLRLRTLLGYVRCWASAAASVWTRSRAMPIGFEPSRSSDRTALCAKQRVPLYATNSLCNCAPGSAERRA
jgi:hypothetical protein